MDTDAIFVRLSWSDYDPIRPRSDVHDVLLNSVDSPVTSAIDMIEDDVMYGPLLD